MKTGSATSGAPSLRALTNVETDMVATSNSRLTMRMLMGSSPPYFGKLSFTPRGATSSDSMGRQNRSLWLIAMLIEIAATAYPHQAFVLRSPSFANGAARGEIEPPRQSIRRQIVVLSRSIDNERASDCRCPMIPSPLKRSVKMSPYEREGDFESE